MPPASDSQHYYSPFTGAAPGMGLVFFLFAIFCACWAQNTNRSPFLWFVLGWLFAPLTGLALLYKNGRDRRASRIADAAPS